MTARVGDYIKTIPEIQAIDMANKSQLADTIAYFKKSQQYNTGNIMDSVTSRLTPEVCANSNPKLTRDDFKSGIAAKINQYLFKKVLHEFKESPYYAKASTDGNKLEKALKLWWAWAGRGVIDRLITSAVEEAKKEGYKDIVIEAYTELKEIKKQYDRYIALFAKV